MKTRTISELPREDERRWATYDGYPAENPCRRCGGVAALVVDADGRGYAVECCSCSDRTAWYDTPGEAWHAWNKGESDGLSIGELATLYELYARYMHMPKFDARREIETARKVRHAEGR